MNCMQLFYGEKWRKVLWEMVEVFCYQDFNTYVQSFYVVMWPKRDFVFVNKNFSWPTASLIGMESILS